MRKGMPGVGRCLSSQHRPLASNLIDGCSMNSAILPSGRAVEGFSPVPICHGVFGTPPTSGQNDGMPNNIPTAGQAPRKLRVLKKEGGLPLGLHRFGTGFRCSTVKNYGAPALVPQLKLNFCTSAGDPVVSNEAGDSVMGQGMENLLNYHVGNIQELRQRVAAQISEMKSKVLGFEARYLKLIRPLLVPRCLIVPWDVRDPWTVFLRRQTYKIFKHNPRYISCFDIMAFEAVCKDEDEWERFLNYLVEKKVYVFEDWGVSLATVEVLMYDHGLKQPDDGTGVPFFKGECDASYDPDTKIANLSYIIWKGDKVIYSEVFSSFNCTSAVEAEMYAACALLYKAEELGITKLLVCCDSKAVVTTLNGEREIQQGDDHRDFFLMLRAMRSRFKWLLVTWKPRELMVFADALTKIPVNDSSNVPKMAKEKWSIHLRGLPIFRIERTKTTAKANEKAKEVVLGDSYGMNGPSTYMIEVEEDAKVDCLKVLYQTLKPSKLEVFLKGDKSDSFNQQLATICRKAIDYGALPGECYKFTGKLTSFAPTKPLVVTLDSVVPKDIYYQSDAFHIVLVTPNELKTMTEKFPPLTALGFVYFNGVRFPLNEKKDGREKGDEGIEEDKLAPQVV